MGQELHSCATRRWHRAIQNSQESLRGRAERHGINQKTVAKWNQRETVADRPIAREANLTVRSTEDDRDRNVRCHSSIATIRATVVGNGRHEHVFALTQSLKL